MTIAHSIVYMWLKYHQKEFVHKAHRFQTKMQMLRSIISHKTNIQLPKLVYSEGPNNLHIQWAPPVRLPLKQCHAPKSPCLSNQSHTRPHSKCNTNYALNLATRNEATTFRPFAICPKSWNRHFWAGVRNNNDPVSSWEWD